MHDTNDVVIREVTLDEVEAYRELRLEGLRLHPDAFGSDYEIDKERPMEYWRDRITKSDATPRAVYVADAGGAFAGMMVVSITNQPKMAHFGWITGVYVRPAWRGCGISDKLFDACLTWARERKLRMLKLAVATANGAAIGCYLRLGFTVFGVDPEALLVDGKYYDELLMMRRLEV